MDLKQQLSLGLNAMQLPLAETAQQQLIDYLHLLDKWNRHFNLTAVRDIQQMVPLHLLDSLSIAPYVSGERILDVGTGAGLPGIPLAIVFPDKQITLLDSNAKKIRFCRQVINELGLKNITAEHSRIQQYHPDLPVQQITTRAFTDLPNMLELLEPLLTDETRVLAMKGQLPEKEISLLKENGYKVSNHQLSVPGVDAKRHLLIIGKN